MVARKVHTPVSLPSLLWSRRSIPHSKEGKTGERESMRLLGDPRTLLCTEYKCNSFKRSALYGAGGIHQ